MNAWRNRMIGLGALAVVLTGINAVPTAMGSEVRAVYQADVRYDEFMPLWREGWPWFDEQGQRVRYAYEGMELGGFLLAYFRNTGDSPLEVKDFHLDGVSVVEGVAYNTDEEVTGRDVAIASLQFSDLPADQIARLEAAGEPVWWKVKPTVIPPGGWGELIVRLRRDPKADHVTLTLPDGRDGTTQTRVDTNQAQARFFTVNFREGLERIDAYLRHPSGRGIAPNRILLDGQDITSRCTIIADPQLETVYVRMDLAEPLTEGQYYVFGAEYPDGHWARACLGAWYMGTVYGMWGSHDRGETPEQVARNFLSDMATHNINVHMLHSSGPGHGYMLGSEGPAMLEEFGIRKMLHWVDAAFDPIFYFVVDEPDAADFQSTMLDPYKRLGGRAQYLVERCKLFRRHDPQTRPLLLNVNNTFKPENWYMYARLADIACADPYFQEGVQSVLHSDPGNMGAYVKPTYVYAVGKIYKSAAAPDPMHLILHTCRFDFPEERTPYRAPTPEEKRIEVYYALASGAQQLSYWWYSVGDNYYGLSGRSPEMRTLWREVGLLGAEVRTLGPVLERSSPADVKVTGPQWLWARSLIAGDDTLVVLAVNDNNFSDRLGTVVRPIENVTMDVTLPAWLDASDVFEITYEGIQGLDSSRDGRSLKVDLDTVNLTRMVVITKDSELRSRLQGLYDSQFKENVQKILSAESE